MDKDAECVGKIGDFGLAQQVSPFCVNILGNFEETAPETWGDYFNLRNAVSYDEKSDIFSFAIILWRLFVGQLSRGSPYKSSGPILRQEIKNVRLLLVLGVLVYWCRRVLVCWSKITNFTLKNQNLGTASTNTGRFA